MFVAGAVCVVGLFVPLFPQLWLRLLTDVSAVMAVGTQHLHLVAPFYAEIGVIFALYFAGPGAQRILWPMTAELPRSPVGTLHRR